LLERRTLRAMSKRFYITTAIDYLNGQPHLGHAYEKIVTDVIARVRRSLGQEVFYLTGLDEHGQKVQQAAVAEGKRQRGDQFPPQSIAAARDLKSCQHDFRLRVHSRDAAASIAV